VVVLLVGGGICAVGAGRLAVAVGETAGDGVGRPGVVSGSREDALPIEEERTSPRIANTRTTAKSMTAA